MLQLDVNTLSTIECVASKIGQIINILLRIWLQYNRGFLLAKDLYLLQTPTFPSIAISSPQSFRYMVTSKF